MMTLRSEEYLPMPTKASDYAALLAALPDGPVGTRGPLGGWLVTLEVPGESPEYLESIFATDGRYMETDARVDLERLGFGTWRCIDPDIGAFEVNSQMPLFKGAEPIGWVETVFSGSCNATSYDGVGQRTTFDFNGEVLRTVTITVKAQPIHR